MFIIGNAYYLHQVLLDLIRLPLERQFDGPIPELQAIGTKMSKLAAALNSTFCGRVNTRLCQEVGYPQLLTSRYSDSGDFDPGTVSVSEAFLRLDTNIREVAAQLTGAWPVVQVDAFLSRVLEALLISFANHHKNTSSEAKEGQSLNPSGFRQLQLDVCALPYCLASHVSFFF